MNNYRDIIKAPIITEKTADAAQNNRTYVFSVDTKANKTQIKQAIEAINKALDQYDVEVDRNFKLEFPPNPDLGDLASTIAL